MTRMLLLLALPLAAQTPEAQIRALRQASNTALQNKDLKSFAASLAPDFTGIRGNGALIPSRQAYIALFQSDFANPAAVRFLRTPDKIELSAAAPLAAEHGHWTGTRPNGAPAFSGTYTAQWRAANKTWQLRSEQFTVLQCHDDDACAAYAPAQQPVSQQFLGVWKLVSYTWTEKATGKTEEPYGPHPVGRITYDAAGRMSAQLMRPDRKSVGGSANLGGISAIRAASADDLREMASGFVSYYGTFTIDEKSKIVTHHVEGALIPSWVGSQQRRSYEFTGDKLILSGAFDLATVRLTWQRQQP